MLGKILFTLAVILVVALIWRTRQPRQSVARAEPRLVNPPQRRRWPIRSLAIAATVMLILGAGVLLYDYWRDRSEVIYIRVVDARSGRAVDYRAARGEIGEREFTTVDGRRIVLAETERLETSIISSPSALGRN